MNASQMRCLPSVHPDYQPQYCANLFRSIAQHQGKAIPLFNLIMNTSICDEYHDMKEIRTDMLKRIDYFNTDTLHRWYRSETNDNDELVMSRAIERHRKSIQSILKLYKY